jgi:hypothetical protein
MVLTNTLTTQTNGYYHYHLLGTGIIANYHIRARQLIYTCERTGGIVDVKELWDIPFEDVQEFINTMKQTYLHFVENGVDFGSVLTGNENDNLN